MSAVPLPWLAVRSDRPVADLAERWGPWLLLAVLAACALGVPFGFRVTLALTFGLGVLLVLGGIWRPPLGLLGVGLLCVLDAPARVLLLTGGLLRWNTISYLLLAVTIVCAPIVLRMRDVHTRLLWAFSILTAAELLISPGLELGVQHLIGVASVFGIQLFAYACRSEEAAWYWLGLLAGALAAGGTLVFLLGQASLPYVNPNAWSHFPLTGILASCLAMPFAERRNRGTLLLTGLAAVNGLWVFLSGSRGNLLVAIAALCLLLTMTRSLWRLAFTLVLLAALAGVVLPRFPALAGHATQRVEALLDEDRSLSSRTSGRSELVRAGLAIFADHPWGVGTGGFAAAWARRTALEGSSGFHRGREFPAHSAWLKTLVENGVPGFLLLAAYVVSFAVAGVRRRAPRAISLGVLATVCLSLAFLSTEFQSKGLWLLAAGVTVLLQYRRWPPRRRRHASAAHGVRVRARG